jgi:hypothetical protein
MTSSTSSAAWLPAAIARAAVVTARPARAVPTRGRHRASEVPGLVQAVADTHDVDQSGRHAEDEWSRQLFDPTRDGVDAFDWLGFTAARH